MAKNVNTPQKQIYIPKEGRFAMSRGKHKHEITHILLSEIIDLKSELRELKMKQNTPTTGMVKFDKSAVEAIMKQVSEVEQENLNKETNLKSEEELHQYRVDFFVEPSNLDGLNMDTRVARIADRLIVNDDTNLDTASHRTEPVFVGRTSKVTQIGVLP